MSPSSTASPNRQIAFINAAHCLCHYTLLILPTAALVMAGTGDFGTAYGSVLELATAMFVCYGLFSLPQGWLAARFGRARMISTYLFGVGASLGVAAFATGPLGLTVALAAAGLFAAIYHPIGTAMLIDAAGERPGRAIGLNGVFGNFGVALAPVVTAFVAAHAGWRPAFGLPALVAIGLGAAWTRWGGDLRTTRATKPFPPVPRALVRQAVLVLMLIAVVSGLVFNAYTILLPKLMQERLASAPSLLPLVGAAAFLVTLCGALTQFTVGRLIDRATLKRVFLPMAVLLVPALVAVAFADGWVVLPLAGLVAAIIFGQVTVNETMAARYVSPALRARIYSIRFFVGFLGSAAAAPVVGGLHDRTGSLAVPVLVLAAFGLITFGCAVFFPNRREELTPELWGQQSSQAALIPVAAE